MAVTLKEIGEAYEQGRVSYASFVKSPSQTTGVGIWYDLSMSSGNPVAQYYNGIALTATALKRSTDVGLNHGQPVTSSYKKFLHKIDIQTVLATAVPLSVRVMDYLMFYSGIAMDAGVQTFTTPISLPRYSASAGVQMMLVELFPYVGSATLQVTYTNQSGVSGRTTPVITLNTQSVFGTIATSAPTTSGTCGIFLPLQSGDYGVQSVDSIEFFGAGDVGVLSLVLVKPLASVHIFENTMSNHFDLFDFNAELPEIKDDAYLNLACLPAGTLAGGSILGNITTLWSAS